MAGLFKLFGGKKENAGLSTGEAIQKLRETEDLLVKKQEYLEKKIEVEMETAKKNASKNKRVALEALKRKNRYAKQLKQIDGSLSTIEMQREALEGANTNTAVLQSMKTAADALKKAHAHMDVDQVHDVMDDIAEQQDLAREISEAISNPVAFGSDLNDDELEDELEKIEQEEMANQLLISDNVPINAPSVPIAEPSSGVPSSVAAKGKAKSDEDDEALHELEMWAS